MKYDMDDKLSLELVRVTEHAAIKCLKWIGKGDKHAADDAAVEGLREKLNDMDISGTVVIGEGERDEAPMLYIGEKVGLGGYEVDIAVDPLEGTTPTAKGTFNSISVMAVATKGTILNAPDTYMDKIAVGPKARGVIDIDLSVKENVTNVANKLNKNFEDMTVVVMDRDRNCNIIQGLRDLGVRVRLIQDCDLSAAICTCLDESEIDMLMGIGAAPEGVLSAAALKTLGGEIQGRLKFRNELEKERAIKMDFLSNYQQKLTMDDMIKSDEVLFVATGVTDGEILNGVKNYEDRTAVNSIVMRSTTKTIRKIETVYRK